ncbi:hypothetical protein, partial [Teichococcus aestuarii]|uniref:hypothetical protein n=1 Tax=Teichococcus aestuarii TaxID=568898 RepID=UPI00361209CB
MPPITNPQPSQILETKLYEAVDLFDGSSAVKGVDVKGAALAEITERDGIAETSSANRADDNTQAFANIASGDAAGAGFAPDTQNITADPATQVVPDQRSTGNKDPFSGREESIPPPEAESVAATAAGANSPPADILRATEGAAAPVLPGRASLEAAEDERPADPLLTNSENTGSQPVPDAAAGATQPAEDTQDGTPAATGPSDTSASGDTDLALDATLPGGTPLEVAVGLDPVEALLGDIDLPVTADLGGL